MNPKTIMTLYLLATLCGIALFIFELFGQSNSPAWMGYLWGIYSLVFAWLTYNTWQKI